MTISHPAYGNYKPKKLIEHLYGVASLMKKECKEDELNFKYHKNEDIKELAYIIGILHDIGKATSYFQNYIKKGNYTGSKKNHSLVSALIAFYIVRNKFNYFYSILVFHIIYRHHQNLVSFYLNINNIRDIENSKNLIYNILKNKNFLKELNSKLNFNIIEILNKIKDNRFKDDLSEIIEDNWYFDLELNNKDNHEKYIENFFLTNYLFSLLVDYDKLDAARLTSINYFKDNLRENILDIDSYLKKLKKENPDKFKNTPINKLRTKFSQEIKNSNKIKKENHFYTITAPTGIGKTYGCLYFANKLKKQIKGGRILYCLPYTSIIDQNYREFEEIIKNTIGKKYKKRPERYLLKHHYQIDKEIKNRKYFTSDYKKYKDDQLLTESWQSSIVVTTFVQFFHSILGYKNRNLKKFHNITNSIVILDEIQNINPEYYYLLKKTLNIFGKVFNTYFLQLTATQPEILSKNIITDVISDKYMKSKEFNRVKIKIDKNKINLDTFLKDFKNEFKKHNNSLIVVNTVGKCIEIYKKLQNKYTDYNIYCLTTNLIPKDRNIQIKEIKNKLKKKQKIIVVSTQLIEAGVDFSFSLVYRDMAVLDSLVQVAGRCNRHGEYGELGGTLKIINLGTSFIYNKELLKIIDEILKEKEYDSSSINSLIQEYYNKINFKKESDNILRAIFYLNYSKTIIEEKNISDFKLINKKEEKIDFYICTDKKSEENVKKLIALRKKTRKTNVVEEELLLKIEKLKYKIIPYKLSMYKKYLKSEVLNYISSENIDIIHSYCSYPYVNYTDYEKIYSNKIGFKRDEDIETKNLFL